MDITVGTFNLNNLFGRWNLYADVPQPPAAVSVGAHPPRDWLEAPQGVSANPQAAEASQLPDVKLVIEGHVTGAGIKWRTNPYDGKIVYKKAPDAQAKLAERIKALDVDVLAVQEVENIEALTEFAETQGLTAFGYQQFVLVEGNDQRLIDVAIISRLPIGAVTSWRHRTYQDKPAKEPIFSRDLLQVEILSEDRSKLLFTLFNNHLKSKLARSEEDTQADNVRRRRQAETVIAILRERPPKGPYVVVGDMNDSPDSKELEPIAKSGLLDALSDPDETGGPYPAGDPDSPATKAWTHRVRHDGQTDYELFDQIWLSADLKGKQTGAWIQRRTTRGGDASDHDPAYVAFTL